MLGSALVALGAAAASESEANHGQLALWTGLNATAVLLTTLSYALEGTPYGTYRSGLERARLPELWLGPGAPGAGFQGVTLAGRF
jgi:hypothetical protein